MLGLVACKDFVERCCEGPLNLLFILSGLRSGTKLVLPKTFGTSLVRGFFGSRLGGRMPLVRESIRG